MKCGIRLIWTLLVFALLLYPLALLLSSSLISTGELAQYQEDGLFPIIPQWISLSQYRVVLLETPLFLAAFWRTLGLAFVTITAQAIIATLNAYVFTKVPFKGREGMFLLFIIAMLLPFQVTVLPTYLMVRRLGMYDTYYAVVVPLLFTPVWTFLLRQAMKQIPEMLLEAVRLESNSVWTVLRHAILPACRTGVATMMMLSFVEIWNMVEQPLIFLSTPLKYPLSLAILQGSEQENSLFAASVVFAVPAIILWHIFSDEIVEGIQLVKGSE